MPYEPKERNLIETDIAAYLKRHEKKDLLRLLTCGSVDDGKSTLIGRLLYDSHMIYEDQLAALMKDSKAHGTTGDDVDPALLTDGLKAEREQGITIDVAYRYFSTDKRKFIIADTPGHEQYTRNMATGASTCNLAIILIDARHGITPQTKRHSFICSLLGIKHAVIAINKMDLMDWSEAVYEKIHDDYNAFVARLHFSDIHFIPLSALTGDNVVDPSSNMPWYNGPTVLRHLENVTIVTDRNLIDMRFPVQCVLRPHLNFRGFSGALASGIMRTGDEIISLPSRRTSKIKTILSPDGEIAEAFAPMAVTITLEDEIDISRGDMLAPVNNLPHIGNQFEAILVWMDETPAQKGRSYLIKQTSNTVPGVLADIRYKIDVNTLRKQAGTTIPTVKNVQQVEAVQRGKESSDLNERSDSTFNDLNAVTSLQLNEIARVQITLHRLMAFDSYEKNRQTGAFILIDRITNLTVGAGMILDRIVSKPKTADPVSTHIVKSNSLVSAEERHNLLHQKGVTLWLTGLSGSGKTTLARQLERKLMDRGHACAILDGDTIRHGLNRDLGFSMECRKENIRRIAEVCRLMNDAGLIVITALISPYRADREQARQIIEPSAERRAQGDEPKKFFEIFVNAPIEICEQRDPKGLYKKARTGEIPQFTGISDPYEPPEHPNITIDTNALTTDQATALVLKEIARQGLLPFYFPFAG